MLGKLKIQLASSDKGATFFQLTFFRPNFKTSSKKTFGLHLGLHTYMPTLLDRKQLRLFLICIQMEIYQDDGA